MPANHKLNDPLLGEDGVVDAAQEREDCLLREADHILLRGVRGKDVAELHHHAVPDAHDPQSVFLRRWCYIGLRRPDGRILPAPHR